MWFLREGTRQQVGQSCRSCCRRHPRPDPAAFAPSLLLELYQKVPLSAGSWSDRSAPHGHRARVCVWDDMLMMVGGAGL